MKYFSYQMLKLYSYFCITYAGNKIPAVCGVSVLFKCGVKTFSEMQGNSVVSFPYIFYNSPWIGSNFVYFLSPKRSLLTTVLQLVKINLFPFLQNTT